MLLMRSIIAHQHDRRLPLSRRRTSLRIRTSLHAITAHLHRVIGRYIYTHTYTSSITAHRYIATRTYTGIRVYTSKHVGINKHVYGTFTLRIRDAHIRKRP
jgi:hypothetical protein